MDVALRLYQIDPKRRYWVIRSGKGGCYINHFRRYNVTAIGHLDEIDPCNAINKTLKEGESAWLTEEQKEQLILAHAEQASNDRSLSRGHAANVNGQIRRFLKEVQVNDIVVTISANEVMAGRVLSDAFLSNELMDGPSDSPEGESRNCNYQIRRKVIWARRYRRDSVPYVFESSFRNVSTIFEVSSRKASVLNHWLSPAHIKGNTLHLSSRIGAERSIGNRSVTQLSSVLDELEALSKSLSDRIRAGKNIDPAMYKVYLEELLDYKYVLTTQQAFMSPGDHFVQLSVDRLQLKVYAVLFAALFNTDLVFADDNPSDLGAETQKNIALLGQRVRENENFDDVKKSLELTMPNTDDRVLDSSKSLEDLFPQSEPSNKTPI